MNRERTCVENGERPANEIRYVYPTETPREIALKLGLNIIFEKPIDMGSIKRISEYRHKAKEIVVFYKEYEEEAIAHELFHFLEKEKDLKLNRMASEEQAAKFAKKLLTNKY